MHVNFLKNEVVKKSVFHLALALVSLFSLDLYAQISNENNPEINVQEYLTDENLNGAVKEFFVRQIRKTNLVKPIDNHKFVHFFVDRYDKHIKSVIKDRFTDIQSLKKSELVAIINDDFMPMLVNAFEARKAKRLKNKLKNFNKNMTHYELYDLGNSGTNKGPGDPCNNADFETGDATGWDLSYGMVDGSSVYSYINVTPTTLAASPHHTIMTGAGTDAMGGFPVVNPDGGSFSLMIGDGIGVNNSAADASQTFLVDASSAAFSYSYAVVLDDNGHSAVDQPYFKINMYDQAGNPIQCGDYAVVAGGSPQDPDFIAYNDASMGPGVYMPWRTTFAPLQAYIGQNVTIEFVVGDCTANGDFGYAYLDASCAAMEIMGPDTITCAGFPTISAPPGAATYLWSPTGETTQSIVATTPGFYQVDVTPVTGAACAITLDKMIYEFIDTVTAVFTAVPDTICTGDPIAFTDQSFLAGGGTITGWEWDFDGNGSVDDTTQNPNYAYSIAGTYNVNLNATTAGCSDDTTMQVVIVVGTTAIFTSDTVCVGQATNFADVSLGGADAWNWDFDNDGIVDNTTQNPSYTFPSAGTFPVNLVVSVGGSCPDDTTINVMVSSKPTAAFTFTNECFGSSTGFTDLSNPNGGVITIWQWDFDNNGVVDNTNQNPINGYPSSGTYTAELYVSAGGACSDSITMQVVVDPIPTANFSTTNVCLNATTTFNDLSTIVTGNINSWAWDFGDASGTSSVQSPTYVYAVSGNYNVSLTVISDSGCINSFNANLDVFSEPIAAFTVTDVCENVAASFIDNSNPNGGTIANWYWDFDNNGTTDNTSQIPTNIYPSDGAYNVQLIVSTSSGCSDTIVQPVTIFPMPISDYTFVNACFGTGVVFLDNSSVTSGNIINWSWNFGNTNNAAIQNPTENYLSEGIYNVKLVASTDNGCKDSITQQIEVWPLPIVDFNPTEVCLNDTTQFTDLSVVSNLYTTNNIVQWNWNFSGLASSTIQNPSHVFSVEGIVPTTLVVTTNNGCIDSVTINVIVDPLPVINFGPDIAACAPVCITLDNTSTIGSGNISSYQWDFGDGSGSGGQTPDYCFDNYSRVASKTFDVSLIAFSDKGCSASLTKPNMITVYPIPYADFIIEPEITDVYDKEISFFDASEIASTWDWDLGDGASSILTNPVHEYADSGSFIVSLYIENTFGCRDTVKREIRIRPAYAIWVANTFTPNGDGINDEFFIDGFGLKEVELSIYNRWGNLLYYRSGLNTQVVWMGDYKGGLVQDDVYVYKARIKDVFNEWHDIIGKVTILK